MPTWLQFPLRPTPPGSTPRPPSRRPVPPANPSGRPSPSRRQQPVAQAVRHLHLHSFADHGPTGELPFYIVVALLGPGRPSPPASSALVNRLIHRRAGILPRGRVVASANVQTIMPLDVQAVLNDGAGASLDPFKITVSRPEHERADPPVRPDSNFRTGTDWPKIGKGRALTSPTDSSIRKGFQP